MNQTQATSPDQAQDVKRVSSATTRLFYLGTAIIMILFAFLGFIKFFTHGQAYPGRPIAPPIRTLVIVHGTIMTVWLFLLLTQTALILSRKHRLHMAVGKLGIALAALILLIGLWVGARSAQVTPPDVVIWSLSPKRFMAVPFASIGTFALFVGLGIYFRKKPQIHRSMMIVATLAVIGAAVSRTDALNKLYLGTTFEHLFGPFFITLCLAVVLLLVRWIVSRRFDKPFAIGVVCLFAICAATMAMARTGAWEQFATMLIG